jgi:hypothetical protein
VKVTLMFTVAALASGAVFAQDRAPAATTAAPASDATTESIFRQLDQDKDSRISSTEAQVSSVVSSSFKQADTNGDGMISHDEFMSSFTARAPTTPPPALPTPPSD